MKNHLKARRIHSISWVLMKSYLITITISLILGIGIFYLALQKEVDYKFQTSDMQALNTFSYLLSRKMMESERVSYNLVINDTVQYLLKVAPEDKDKNLKEILRKEITKREDIKSIHIMDLDGNVFSEYQEPTYNKDAKAFRRQLNLEEVKARKGGAYWEIGENILEKNNGPTFYMTRLINSKEDMKPLGYIVIYLNPDNLRQECNNILANITLDIIIQDGTGQTICMADESRLSAVKKIKDQIRWEENKYYHISKNHRKYYYVVEKMPIINGYIVGINHQSRTNYNISIILIFAVMSNIIFIIIASLIIKRKVVWPLKYIASKARIVGEEKKLDEDFYMEEGYLEVYDISDALNEMMGQINELIIDVAQREKLQKRLELSIINHQVKPHFLYNTLNAASILVAIEEKDAAIELIKTLAKYYRACLSRGDESISIAEEIQIVEEYIKIAIIRKPNSVVMHYDIDERTLEFKIPKITIQSLVENSLKYGVKKAGVPVHISISTHFDEAASRMIVTVEDDGNGMSEEIIEKIMKGEKLEAKSGFGLKAIIARLCLNYDIKDTKEVIEIESKCKEYTRIKLYIPI